MKTIILLLLLAASAIATEFPAGFTSLFNGRDLSGWRGRPHLDRDYGDFELVLDWMLPEPCGDSGVYLRGNPQVQIWDPNCERDFKLGCQKGSGGLWNNAPGSEGKDPLVKADKPTGEWSTMRMRIQGDRVTVHLNDQLVVDNQSLANSFAKAAPLPARGPIQIQTHNSPLRIRNVFIRKLGTLDGSGAR